MFYTQIRNLTLGSDLADEYFSNIYGDCYRDDSSFLATLRALLAERVGKNNLMFRVRDWYCDAEYLNCFSSTKIVDQVLTGTNAGVSDSLKIIYFTGGQETRDTFFQAVTDHFLKMCPGYIREEIVEIYLRKLTSTLVYINPDTKSSIVFIKDMSLELYHFIQSAITKILPWYFNDGNMPPTQEELALLKCFCGANNADEYRRQIEVFAKKFDFREIKIKNLLGDFEKKVNQVHLENVKNQIHHTEDAIGQNLNEYKKLVDQRSDLIIRRLGLEQQIKDAGEESEIMEYFLSNKLLSPISCTDYEVRFIVNCYLDNYDPDIYETYADNPNSYIYTSHNSLTDELFRGAHDVRRKFLDAIFGDSPALKVKMCAYYVINLNGNVNSIEGYNYPQESQDRLPNPHLDRYNCFGDYRRYIIDYLMNGDYILAIEQCIASAKSINIGEGATFPHFLESLFSTDCAEVIELPDGTSVTPKEAYNWLLEQEKGSGVTAQETEMEDNQNGETN